MTSGHPGNDLPRPASFRLRSVVGGTRVTWPVISLSIRSNSGREFSSQLLTELLICHGHYQCTDEVLASRGIKAHTRNEHLLRHSRVNNCSPQVSYVLNGLCFMQKFLYFSIVVVFNVCFCKLKPWKGLKQRLVYSTFCMKFEQCM